MLYCTDEPCKYLRYGCVCPDDDFDEDRMALCAHPDAHSGQSGDKHIIGFDDSEDFVLTPEWCPRSGRGYT